MDGLNGDEGKDWQKEKKFFHKRKNPFSQILKV